MRNQYENEDILEKANCNFGFLQLLFYIFMYVLIDMIDNIILNPYYVTRTPANESAL